MSINGKMKLVETIPGIEERDDKGEWWRRWIQALYIWYIERTFVNATMYPEHNNLKKKKVGPLKKGQQNE
jgi:hypothetical protein